MAPDRVRVSVPATSANLGPGFDCLGLALELRDTLTASLADRTTVVVRGEGADSVSRDESHLVISAMRTAFELMGDVVDGIALECDNVVPHTRGLGSSSAAIVAGVELARRLSSTGMSDDQAFQLCASMEGHPDNVAPAFFGGFCVCGYDGTSFYATPSPVATGVSVVVFVPPFPLETTVARALLPATVAHSAAAANTAAGALLVAALASGDERSLWRATRDWLHQEYRRPAMPESLSLIDALRADGVPAVVSGAGPTVLAFCVREPQDLVHRCPDGWAARVLAIDPRGVTAG